ncbi:hypothetical protein JTB14_030621 [Gonioctena quinquepunctata]|nr:hypothetical protein JTB14_030621 [Gonioctena quinquepunctata]
MNVLSRTPLDYGERITIRIEGPSHLGVMLSPVEGVVLDGWSLETDELLAGPLWNGRKTYFIYYAYGLEAVPFELSLDFKFLQYHDGPVMDIAVTSHYLFGPGKASKQLKNFVNQFPSWTTVTYWTASMNLG